MKKFDDLFRDSKRLKPSQALWQKIESQVVLKPAESEWNTTHGFDRLWHSPLFKLAASVTLTTCLLGFGMFMQHRSKAGSRLSRHAESTQLHSDSNQVHGESVATEFLDPDILGWDADLGEMELDADDSAEEVL